MSMLGGEETNERKRWSSQWEKGPPGESGQEAESSSEPVVTGSDAAEKQEAGGGRASGLGTW